MLYELPKKMPGHEIVDGLLSMKGPIVEAAVRTIGDGAIRRVVEPLPSSIGYPDRLVRDSEELPSGIKIFTDNIVTYRDLRGRVAGEKVEKATFPQVFCHFLGLSPMEDPFYTAYEEPAFVDGLRLVNGEVETTRDLETKYIALASIYAWRRFLRRDQYRDQIAQDRWLDQDLEEILKKHFPGIEALGRKEPAPKANYWYPISP